METQVNFFNSVAHTWDEICYHDMEKIEYILDLIDIKEGSCVLDVGTGTGVLIPSLSNRVSMQGRVKAIDIAENMIKVAKKKNVFKNVCFECKDALDLNEDIYYDYIICYSMFPHFKNRQKEAILKLAENLESGGKLTICHSQSRDDINNFHKNKNKAVKEDNLPAIPILRQLFEVAGLKVVKEIDNKEIFLIIGCKQNIG